jgi:hypothetical protein
VAQSKLVLNDAAFAQVLVAAQTLAASRQVKRVVTVFMLVSPRSLRDPRIAMEPIDLLDIHSFALGVSQCKSVLKTCHFWAMLKNVILKKYFT